MAVMTAMTRAVLAMLTAMKRAVVAVAVAVAKVLVLAVLRDAIVSAFYCIYELLWGGPAGTGSDNNW